jgi:hypothetical protein
LTADERLEYQEINEFARHDDTVMLAVSSLLLPTLFAALALAWQPTNNGVRVPLALGSFVVWLYWATVTQRRGEFAAIRYRRAQQLECKAKLDHHLRIDAVDRASGPWSRWRRIKTMEAVGSLSFVGAWLWLITSPYAQSEALVSILVATAITLVIYGVATRKSHESPPCEQSKTEGVGEHRRTGAQPTSSASVHNADHVRDIGEPRDAQS